MEDFSKLVDAECDRGIKKHGHLNSYHEGLAVLWEEFEELKAEVFAQTADIDNMRTELVQIAAVCKKFWQQTFGKEYFDKTQVKTLEEEIRQDLPHLFNDHPGCIPPIIKIDEPVDCDPGMYKLHTKNFLTGYGTGNGGSYPTLLTQRVEIVGELSKKWKEGFPNLIVYTTGAYDRDVVEKTTKVVLIQQVPYDSRYGTYTTKKTVLFGCKMSRKPSYDITGVSDAVGYTIAWELMYCDFVEEGN